MKNFLMIRRSAHSRGAARQVAIVLFAAVLLTIPFNAAFAGSALALGSADGFAVLAGSAVTCTDSTVIGDVGVWPGTAITQTNCEIEGTVHTADAVAEQAYGDFLDAYDALAQEQCDEILSGDLGGVTLNKPGVYCVDAASTTTDGTLWLKGASKGVWIFKIGTDGTGALTGTNFDVVMENGDACNVYWWVAEAATMTDSAFQGTILAGDAITITGGLFDGDALAQAAVTMTGTTVTGCEQLSRPVPVRSQCNQGVGNGPEDCDPGNSNQGDPSRSNDELGGTPGDPGRMGGNSI